MLYQINFCIINNFYKWLLVRIDILSAIQWTCFQGSFLIGPCHIRDTAQLLSPLLFLLLTFSLELLPVRSMRQGYVFVSVGMCVCVSSKNMPVCVLQLENLHENTLCSFSTEFIVLWRRFLSWQALFEWLIHGYLKLRVLVRVLTVLWVCRPTSYHCNVRVAVMAMQE